MPSGDLDAEMPSDPLDEATADRLLAGALHPADAPPGYGQVAALVAAAREVGNTTGLPGRDAAVSAIAAAIARAPGISLSRPRRRSRRMSSKLLTLKALGIALPAMALTGGGVAAASDALPGPAQSAVSSALSTVGLHVPDGRSDTSPPANAVGPNVSVPAPAKFGLCTAANAQADHNHHPSSRSVAFANLAKAASAAGETVRRFCTGVTPPSGKSDASVDVGGANAGTGNGSGNDGGRTPAGPPLSTPAPGSTPVSTPAGPPSSVPAGKPSVTPPGGP